MWIRGWGTREAGWAWCQAQACGLYVPRVILWEALYILREDLAVRRETSARCMVLQLIGGKDNNTVSASSFEIIFKKILASVIF